MRLFRIKYDMVFSLLLTVLCCGLLVSGRSRTVYGSSGVNSETEVSVAEAAGTDEDDALYEAEVARNDYRTTQYDMDIRVDEDHCVHVKETITVDFIGRHHGIQRYIPEDNSQYSIENINVPGYKKKIKSESGNVNIRIGNASKYLEGVHTYEISYDLRYYRDADPSADELLIDLLPTGWETPIDNSSITLQLPKSFDQDEFAVYLGQYGSSEVLDPANYYLDGGNGEFAVDCYHLGTGAGLTAQLKLPEGYWVNVPSGRKVPVWFWCFLAAAPALMLLLFLKFGRDPQVIETVEFEAPDGMTPVEAGYYVDGEVDNEDISSMLIYFAQKGYLGIHHTKRKAYKAIKLKEIAEDEKEFAKTLFEGLFKKSYKEEIDGIEYDTVNLRKMPPDFSTTIKLATNQVETAYKEKALFTENSESCRAVGNILIFALAAVGSVLTTRRMGLGFTGYIVLFMIEGAALVFGVSLLHGAVARIKTSSVKRNLKRLFGGSALTFLVFGILAGIMYRTFHRGDLALAFLASAVLTIIFTSFSLARTEESAALQGRLLGFRNYIKTAEYDRIKRMSDEDPEYYFKIMPYAMVFDMSTAWADKFTNIRIEQPRWYVSDMASDRVFSAMMFSEAMNTTTRNWSSQFSNSPDSGGSSGGGFSGGGGGGGGGGAW